MVTDACAIKTTLFQITSSSFYIESTPVPEILIPAGGGADEGDADRAAVFSFFISTEVGGVLPDGFTVQARFRIVLTFPVLAVRVQRELRGRWLHEPQNLTVNETVHAQGTTLGFSVWTFSTQPLWYSIVLKTNYKK